MNHENVSDVMEMAKWLKERRVATGDVGEDGSFDIAPSVVFWRAGREVAQIMAQAVQRDSGLDIAVRGVHAFGADRVAMVNDTFYASPKWFTDRGRIPRAGELQRVFEKGRTDLVSEALNCVWADRGGDAWMITVPYRLDRVARALEWPESDDDDLVNRVVGGKQLGGLIPATLRGAFDQPDLMVEARSAGFAPEDFGLTDAEARLHADIASVRVITAMVPCSMVWLPAYSEDDVEIIKESMERMPGLEYYMRPDDDPDV